MAQKGSLKTFLELAKVKITFAVSFTTITGFLLASRSLTTAVVLPTLGIFLLACGSSVLNHIQECRTDKMMERTKNRPLPSGKITLLQAGIYMTMLVLSGSLLLWTSAGIIATTLGLTALVWYNFIYTPLKRKTAYAVIPGSVIGSIPPLVGWVAGGGDLTDSRVLPIILFFFIWQVPHFWLLVLKYGDDYAKAGFPSITKKHSLRFVTLSTFMWILATAVMALLLPVFKVVESTIVSLGILLNVIWLLAVFGKLLFVTDFSPGKYFMKINYFVLVMIVLLMLDHVFIG